MCIHKQLAYALFICGWGHRGREITGISKRINMRKDEFTDKYMVRERMNNKRK